MAASGGWYLMSRRPPEGSAPPSETSSRATTDSGYPAPQDLPEPPHSPAPVVPSAAARPSEADTFPARSIARLEPAPATTSPAATVPAPPARPPKKPLQDPVARKALALVGVDAQAEEVWLAAINNPDLPANERKDLIEDLNEEGLSDPKHPTPEDLPVIVRRIQLIEAFQKEAMDEVNAEAFREAYKDLMNLGNVAAGSGERVK